MSKKGKSSVILIEFFLWSGLLALQFYLSSQPTLPVPLPPFRYSDKIVHFSYFFTVSLLGYKVFLDLLTWLFRMKGALFWSGWMSFTISALFGIMDEIHQLTVPGRHGTLGDIAADILGAAFGFFVGMAIWKDREKRVEER